MFDEKITERQKQYARDNFEEKLGKRLKEICYPKRRLFTDEDYQKLFSELFMFLYDEMRGKK